MGLNVSPIGGTTLTDSASLRSALSDETGTGAAVFADTPTLVTPNIGAATGTSLALSGALSASNVGGANITIVANGLLGITLTGAVSKSIFGSNLPTGDNDLYTCPAGKRALFGGVNVYNQSAGTIAWYMEMKTAGGTYYRLLATSSTTTGAATATSGTAFILEAGEKVSVNTATNTGLNIWLDIVEFDNTNPLFTKYVEAPASGDNTVYTCAAGKVGKISSVLEGGGSPSVKFVNSSGGSLNLLSFVVPSGGSSGNTNKMTPSAAVANLAIGSIACYSVLAAGDFLVLNISGTGTASIMYVTILELPQ